MATSNTPTYDYVKGWDLLKLYLDVKADVKILYIRADTWVRTT